MRRLIAASVLAFLPVSLFAADDCLALFLKAKEEFRFGKYDATLALLDRLEIASAEPGNERYRMQLPAGLAFYRGVSLAALGRVAEATPQIELFLAYEPNASLDPGAYPPRVIDAFASARKELTSSTQKPAETGSLATSYRAYEAPVEKAADEAGEDWADGPARFLLTGDQREDYERLSDPASRSEFITEFWKARDPRLETPENEARVEYEKRVAFADVRFAQDETRGSLTDRGMVFILMGPPTWVGRKPIQTGDDANEPNGMSQYTNQDVENALKGTSSAGSQRVFDKMTGPNTKLPDSDGNYREVWHFRRELLPAGISYHQVDFDFISKKGYGKNVWQREARTLTTLEKARTAVRNGAFTRTAAAK
jgi:GWxTD domain-containing protein